MGKARKIVRKAKKAVWRVYRIMTFRKGIYGKYGKACSFQCGSCLDEESTIGSYNYVGKYTNIGAATVGNYCSFGDYVTIGPGEHPLDMISTCCRVLTASGAKYDLNEKPISIGNDVWIGTKATILRGVTVADGAVIAAGSLVKKDVPAYAIVAGVPAKIIRFRKNDEEINEIVATKWWDYSLEEAAGIVKMLEAKKYEKPLSGN